ncbi:MAG: zf-HC2 domain-containing protein [Methylophaga sp.]|nr:zf-HC2 domain-containing protein [Methylophaga sp.]
MLSCKEIAQQASDYIDQQYSWRQRMAFRLHLFICSNCRRYINQLDSTIESLKLVKRRPQTVLSAHQKELARQLGETIQKR